MKNKQIKNLWVLTDKLRGAFEVSELYRIMLYGTLFKYAEYEKEYIAEYEEKYSLGYLSLTYGKIVSLSELLDYLRKLERGFGLETGVILESFEQVFKRVDSENIRIIFENLNEIEINSKEDCYKLAQYIVNKMMSSMGRHAYECSTNEVLTKLEAALLDVQNGMTVYDAYCGTGMAINEVAAGKGKVFMQDMNISTIGIAAIMSVLSDNKIGVVRCADSLHNPIELNSEYDRVICEPPFIPRYDKDYIASIPMGNCIYQESLESESLALRHSIAVLKDDGIAVVLVPMGMLFKSGRMGDIRKRLIVDSYIDAIIELPGGIVRGTPIATALVVLKKNKEQSDIVMINAKEFCTKTDKLYLTLTDENIERLIEIYRKRQVIEGISNVIDKDTIASNDYNLCTTQYVTQNASRDIVVEDNAKFIKEYKELSQRLGTIDGKLNLVRSRFVKEV